MRLALLAVVALAAVPAFKVDVHPAPAAGVDLKAVVSAAATRALAQLPHHGEVTIDVLPNRSELIPQVGVGGYTGTGGNVEITWDSTRLDERHLLLTWLPLTVAHELDHSSRFRDGAGFGGWLGDHIVAEGLADHFARQVFPDAPQAPWDHALTRAQERAYWRLVQPALSRYDRSGLFWGDNGKFPVWAGYSLGYDIVGRYLAMHHLTGAQAVRVDSGTILAAFHGP